MASIENDPVCADDDLEDEDDESEEEYLVAPSKRQDEIDEDDVEEDPEEDEDTSSSNIASGSEPILPHHSTLSSPQLTVAASVAADPVAAVQTLKIALPATDSSLDFKRQQTDIVAFTGINKALKPLAVFDESRRLFQRLWTDEDEIELLQGFLDYTKKQRLNAGSGNASSYHHDTSAFYDQIKSKLQLDFNKSQLVEKLRRLKKKYRTIIAKIGSGKDYVFKSPHDQTTFEISKKIWSADGRRVGRRGGGGGGGTEEGGLEDYETNQPHPNRNSIDDRHNGLDAYSLEKKSGRSRKRSRGGAKMEVKPEFHELTTSRGRPTGTCGPSPRVIEETVRSCISPLLKDLFQNGLGGGGMAAAINPLGFGLGGRLLSSCFSGGKVMEEKWRKQQIMELEVYSKRLELVQDQIKSALEELRSVNGSLSSSKLSR